MRRADMGKKGALMMTHVNAEIDTGCKLIQITASHACSS